MHFVNNSFSTVYSLYITKLGNDPISTNLNAVLSSATIIIGAIFVVVSVVYFGAMIIQQEKDKYFNKTIGDTITTDLSRVTDDDREYIAKKFYQDEINSKKNSAKSNYSSKVKSANNSYQKTSNSIANKLEQVGTLLASELKNIKEQGLKNNIARSSITTESNKNSQNKASEQTIKLQTELTNAEQEKQEDIESAKRQLDRQIYDIDYSYAKPIADKQNELQDLKDKNSSYAQSLVNKTALSNYENAVMDIVHNYLNNASNKQVAKEQLNSNNFLEQFLTKKQIEEIFALYK